MVSRYLYDLWLEGPTVQMVQVLHVGRDARAKAFRALLHADRVWEDRDPVEKASKAERSAAFFTCSPCSARFWALPFSTKRAQLLKKSLAQSLSKAP